MRVFIFAAIVAMVAVVASMVSAGAPRLSICKGSTSILEGATIKSPESNWSPETTVHFIVEGTLKEAVSGGVIQTLAYFSGVEVENKQDPLCTYEGTPFKCPEATGVKSWTFPFAIPSVPWSGELTSHSEFKTGDGKLLFCMDLAVDL